MIGAYPTLRRLTRIRVTLESLTSPCVFIKNLDFEWENGVRALSVREFSVRSGEKLFLRGPSGSGKSTLLGVIAGVFSPSAGEATILDQPFHSLGAAKRDALRADAMGVIFQQFNLVPYLTLIENVLLPCRFSKTRAARVGASASERADKAQALLSRLGLEAEARERRPAAKLSVGQQQRVAAARALIGEPSLVIADEPTSALDTEARDAFIRTLLTEAKNAAVIFVSHDASLSSHFDRECSMESINFVATETSPTRNVAHAVAEG